MYDSHSSCTTRWPQRANRVLAATVAGLAITRKNRAGKGFRESSRGLRPREMDDAANLAYRVDSRSFLVSPDRSSRRNIAPMHQFQLCSFDLVTAILFFGLSCSGEVIVGGVSGHQW